MPNLDAPNGFQPVRHLKGGTIRFEGKYEIASGYATSLFSGDPVLVSDTTGLVEVAVGGPTTPSAAITGIFAGCQYVAANGDVVWSNQWVGGTATSGAQNAEAFLYTDPDVIYSVQYGGTLTATDIGQLFDFLDSSQANGNAANGISAVTLEAVTGGTQFKLHRLAMGPDGIYPADITAANPRVEVSIVGTTLDVAR